MMEIYKKLLEARKAMSFEKEYNRELKYEILDGDSILEMVGNALAEQNILCIPSMVGAEMTWHEVTKTYNDRTDTKLVQHALAILELTFVDAETGESFKAETRGSAQDYADKALGKAQTYAIKYFFARMFLKGKSDVNDEERVGDDHTAPARPQTAQDARKQAHSQTQVATTATPPATPQNGSSELDDVVWTRDAATLNNMVAWAVDFWTMDGEQPPTVEHARNRICKALRLTSPIGNANKFRAIMAAECKLAKAAVIEAIKAYVPDGDAQKTGS